MTSNCSLHGASVEIGRDLLTVDRDDAVTFPQASRQRRTVGSWTTDLEAVGSYFGERLTPSLSNRGSAVRRAKAQPEAARGTSASTLGARSVELTDDDIGDTQVQLLYVSGVGSQMRLGEVSRVPFTLTIERPVGDRVETPVRERRLVQRPVEGYQARWSATCLAGPAGAPRELSFERRSMVSAARADLFEERTEVVALRGRP